MKTLITLIFIIVIDLNINAQLLPIILAIGIQIGLIQFLVRILARVH